METLNAIRGRYSCRAFSDAPVPDALLEKIVAAGGLAAIGRRQFANVFLTVIRDPRLLKEAEELTRELRGNPALSAFYGAPVLVCVSVKADDSLGKENSGCVIQNMMVAAADLGVDSVFLHSPCGVFEANPALYARLGAPEGFVPCDFVALGYASGDRPGLRTLENRIPTKWL